MSRNEYDDILGSPQRNDYDDLLGPGAAAERPLREAMLQSVTSTPERQAEVLKLSQKTKLPAEIVDRNFDMVKQRDRVESNDYDRILRETPKLAAWIADPQNAKLSSDDLPQLGHLETLLDLGKSFATGAIESTGTALSGIGTLFETSNAAIDRAFGKLGIPSPKVSVPWWMDPKQFLRAEGSTLQDLARSPGIQVPINRQNFATQLSGSLGQFLPFIATAIVAPEAAPALEPLLFAGQGAEQFRERAAAAGRLGTPEAETGILSAGAVNAIVGEFGVGQLLERLPPKIGNIVGQKLADITLAGGYQAGLQAALTLAQNVATRLSVDPNQPITQDLVDQLKLGGATGAVARLILGVALPGISGRLERSAAARQQKDLLRALGEGVTDSKTFNRLPEKLQEFVRQATKDGPIEKVYIPVDEASKYFQDNNMNPEELFGDEGAERYRQAQQTHEDVELSLSDYVTRIAPSEHANFFNEVTRVGDPEAMNARESEAFTQVSRKEIGPTEQKELTTEQNSLDASAERVGEDIRGQLLGQGFPPDVVDSYARIYTEAFRTMGLRSGQDPFTLYEQHPVTITRPLPEILRQFPDIDTRIEPLIDRLRAGTVPTQQEMFGTSLLDFLRAKGGVQDEGGDLASREPDKERQPFQQRLINPEGLPIDAAREAAAEAGYIEKNSTVADFLDAIDRELRGQPVYAAGAENPEAVEQSIILQDLDNYLKQRGVDVQTASNADIKKLLEEAAEVPAIDAATGTVLGQTPVDVPGLKPLLRYMTPEERGKMRQDIAQTFVTTFQQLPPDADFKAAALAGIAKKGWYRQSSQAILGVFGPDAPRFAALLAAMSPQTSVETNIRNAVTVWKTWLRAGRPRTDGAIRRVLAAALGGPESVLEAWANNSVRALSHPEPERIVLSGPKVNSFAANLRNNVNEVTLDTWMGKFAMLDQALFDGELNVAGTEPGKRAPYIAYAAKIRRVAETLTEETGESWTPAEVQETIWSWAKTAVELAAAKGEDRSVEDLVRDGAVTDRAILSTPDFASLFDQDAHLRKILEAAGYGQQLEVLRREFAKRPGRDTGAPGRGAEAALAQAGPADTALLRSARRLDRLRRGAPLKTLTDIKQFFQDEPSAGAPSPLYSDKRGTIYFGPDRKFRIDLLRNADLSTFLHETGHFYLEVFGDIVDELRTRPGERTDTESRMVADYDKVLAWMGVDSREAIGRKQHEQFARGFEAYLREGKAPNPELRSLFQRFKAWLVNIYRSVTQLNVNLTPEVRDVFDRLLASDEEIGRAREDADIRSMIENQGQAERLGMSGEEYRIYGETVRQARDRQQEALDREYLDEFQRRSQDWYRVRREETRSEVAREVHSQKGYIVLSFLKNGTLPDGSPLPIGEFPNHFLDAGALEEVYGKYKNSSVMQALERMGVYRREGGMDPQAAAQMLGYSSTDEMVQALVKLRPMDDFIDAETDDRMKQTYGDVQTDSTIGQRARDAVVTEGRPKVIEAEMRALAKKIREEEPVRRRGAREAREADKQARRTGMETVRRYVPSQALAKSIAEGRLAGMRDRDIRPATYFAATRRESTAALEALNRGDFDEALTHKQRELVNVEMYRAASNWQKERDSIRERMLSYDDPKKRSRIGKAGEEYLEQIDSLRERFEFSRQTGKALARRASLAEFIKQQEAAGHELDVPASIRDEAFKTNYREMTVEQMRGLNDAVKTIEHWAAFKNRLLRKQLQRELSELGRAGAVSIDDNSRGKRELTLEMRLPGQERGRRLESFFLAHLPLGSITREMDGFKDGGFLFENVMRPVDEAGHAEAVRLEHATEAVLGIYRNAYRGEETSLWQKQFIPEIHDSLTKWGRLMVALNWGNDGNRQRVRSGFGWNDQQVAAILDTLDHRDWKFVQAIWNHINEYWPEISDKQQRVTGVRPEKVDASPVQTKFGEFPGGYFPISYESRLTARAAGNEEVNFAKLITAASYTKATTARGHTEARLQNVKMPLRLDPGVITEHLQQVIHDLTHHEMLIDVGRILGRKDISDAIYRNYGDNSYKEVMGHIRDIALGTTPVPNWYRTFAAIRSNAVTARLGWNAVTALIHVPNITAGMVRVGPKWVMKGVLDSLSSAKGAEHSAQWVAEQSDMMRLRWKHRMIELSEFRDEIGLNRGKLAAEIHDAVQKLGIDPEVGSHFKDSYLYAIHRILQFAEIPTWVGAYEKAIGSGRDPGDARAQADRAIIDAIGSGQVKDTPGIQKGAIGKIFTTFMTYQLSMHRLGREVLLKNQGALRKLVDGTLLVGVPMMFVAGVYHIARPPKKEEPFATEVGAQALDHAVGMFAGVRELQGALRKPDYQGPASFGVVGALRNAIFRIGAGEGRAHEYGKATARAINEAAGELFGYPAGQLDRTIEGILAMWEGKTRNPDVLLFGPPRR